MSSDRCHDDLDDLETALGVLTKREPDILRLLSRGSAALALGDIVEAIRRLIEEEEGRPSPDADRMACQRCARVEWCEEVAFMGYTAWLCRACAAAAYASGEAV